MKIHLYSPYSEHPQSNFKKKLEHFKDSNYIRIILILLLFAIGQMLLLSSAYGAVPGWRGDEGIDFLRFVSLDASWTLAIQLIVLVIIGFCTRERMCA